MSHHRRLNIHNNEQIHANNSAAEPQLIFDSHSISLDTDGESNCCNCSHSWNSDTYAVHHLFFFVDEVCHTSNTKPLSRGDD